MHQSISIYQHTATCIIMARSLRSIVGLRPSSLYLCTTRCLSTSQHLLAGHSKWANIKHAKAAQDKKRSITFNRCSKDIVTAIRVSNGETNLDVNARLRTAINAARAVDMPKDKIEAAIRLGSGEGVQPQAFVFECTAPGGILMVIDAEADKRVNALQDLNKWLHRYDGVVGNDGTALWAFDRQGHVEIPAAIFEEGDLDPEELALEVDADDVTITNSGATLVIDPKALSGLETRLRDAGVDTFMSGVKYLPHSHAHPSKADLDNFVKMKERLMTEVESIFAIADNLPSEQEES
eukprot:m.28964 g.28964  ORF g.28964 m.28964 type:complete len:294 (+) comp11902_c0_seq2:155-1036(+)